MTRPSCSVIEQKVQPPKQPRMSTIECFTVSNAGIRSVYIGCGTRVNGRSYSSSIETTCRRCPRRPPAEAPAG